MGTWKNFVDFLKDNGDTSHLMALITVITFNIGLLIIIFWKAWLFAQILLLSEASSLIILVCLAPNKIIGMIEAWMKTKSKV